MEEQIKIQKLLNEKLTEAQVKNPAYSLRSFASKLGIEAGSLSQILNGNRKISKKMAARICDALLVDPIERSQTLSAFEAKKTSTTGTGATLDSDEYLKISADQFSVISDWHHFAILSLVKTKDFKNNSRFISERLGIGLVDADRAVKRLIRLGMLEEKNSKLVRTQAKVRTSDDIASTSVKRAHFQTLELAKQALEKYPVEQRDYTTITMPTDPECLPEAKELIRKFQQDLCDLMTKKKNPTEVYRLSVELFPLTHLQPLKTQTLHKK